MTYLGYCYHGPRWAAVLLLILTTALLVGLVVMWVRDERQARGRRPAVPTPDVRAYPGGGVIMRVPAGLDLTDPAALLALGDRVSSAA